MRATSAALSSAPLADGALLSRLPLPIRLVTSSTRSESSVVVRFFSSNSASSRSFSDVVFCSSLRAR